MNSRDRIAANATLHCLTGCAIGEIPGLMIGTAFGLSPASPFSWPSDWPSFSATPCLHCRLFKPGSASLQPSASSSRPTPYP
ncbi:DUF4396 domain-containing protein [Arthrobacter globiformis]|uniref:DUF4396 domain-containing protein n=1 Tax=Arthrobacter globiformis TaxID=1665 RepID=UPI00358FCC4F